MPHQLGAGQLAGSRKAAILLAILGEEAAATILRALPEDDLQRLTQEIARPGAMFRKKTSLKVMEEYQHLAMAQEYIAQGGQDAARRMLVKAFGENGARDMVQRLVRANELKCKRGSSRCSASTQSSSRGFSRASIRRPWR